ncbi:MAG: ATP-binding cassette domain-containing protein, partial [Lachnospiraceae bacterium]|nr:ATP-binding cassette domain-containing protein [Lachnospiraceae bacterium]
MSDDERTVLMELREKQPELVCFWDGQVHEMGLSGKQRLGRATSQNHPELEIPMSFVSRKQGEFDTESGRSRYRDCGSSNGTLHNGKLLKPDQWQELQDGDVLRIRALRPDRKVADILMVYTTSYQEYTVWKNIDLNEEIAELKIGRQDRIALSDQSVSRHHASFFRVSRGWAVIDHGSLNGVYVNNKRITQPMYLPIMSVVRIAGYLFFYTGDKLYYQIEEASSENAVQETFNKAIRREGALSIYIEERNVWHRMKKKTLLRDINIEIPRGSFVLILGGSGAGKTTFMNAVMGYEKADGQILYQNTDLYAEYKKMKYEIGYVPQQDMLRMNDTVYDTLLNAARMRLSNLSEEEYADNVQTTMTTLGLEREQDSLVGKLSGGQRKRLSIAVEYIGNPSLFFLDEPDSGLDGAMARALMKNLRAIADEGKIVMVISHSPDRAFQLFDQVIVLAKDSRDNCGHLAYTGSPKDACAFFDAEDLEHIVQRINRPDEGGDGLADYYIRRYEAQRGRAEDGLQKN